VPMWMAWAPGRMWGMNLQRYNQRLGRLERAEVERGPQCLVVRSEDEIPLDVDENTRIVILPHKLSEADWVAMVRERYPNGV
jgi:hypothetical protein